MGAEARWLSPWAWSCRPLGPVLRSMREAGPTEEPAGEILAVRLTGLAEWEMAPVLAEWWVNA